MITSSSKDHQKIYWLSKTKFISSTEVRTNTSLIASQCVSKRNGKKNIYKVIETDWNGLGTFQAEN